MISLFDLFKIGIGPSSSHTVGPMIAAKRFASDAVAFVKRQPAEISCSERVLKGIPHDSELSNEIRVTAELFGSLALTGLGHATDVAVIAGLSGIIPSQTTPEIIEETVKEVNSSGNLSLNAEHPIRFDERRDLVWERSKFLPEHPNGLRFRLLRRHATPEERPGTQGDLDGDWITCLEEEYFSTGGGFVYTKQELVELKSSLKARTADPTNKQGGSDAEYPFMSANELLQMCDTRRITIAQLMDSSEEQWRSASEISMSLQKIWDVMQTCIDRGCVTEGRLPGTLRLDRRAKSIFSDLKSKLPFNISKPSDLISCQHNEIFFSDPLLQMDWVSLFALAVNEENAAGGRVVTAPTNGAAGVIPAVLAYYLYFVPGAQVPGAQSDGVQTFLKTAGAIGLLYKRNASLSAAEMGCQGEVGVACSMAAAGLAAVMGGTVSQIENAAEIGMEHNLGLTCDPIAGLVQIPCIERNTMGAVKAINAARLAVLYGTGRHFVSLDHVIETMRQTGLDMQNKYKETSLGGLAVNVVDC